ncbi:MAG TPA: TIGR00730 family Rossman fold protein [Vicinamibacteria bacterium]
MTRVCVFCGSSPGRDPRHLEAALALGRQLVERRLHLVYGGARVGLMGALADEVLARGGTVTGVIPRGLVDREIAHATLLDLRVVADMHARKALMAELADAFLALPGGFGTLEELFEVVTWVKLGIHDKPVGLLNVAGYYDGLLRQVERAVSEAFVSSRERDQLLVADEPKALLDQLVGRALTDP